MLRDLLIALQNICNILVGKKFVNVVLEMRSRSQNIRGTATSLSSKYTSQLNLLQILISAATVFHIILAAHCIL